MSPQYGELWPTSGWDRSGALGHPCKFQRVSRLGSVTALHFSIGRQPNFAALNRGRHLYSAGRPWRWALAHILVLYYFIPKGTKTFTTFTGVPQTTGWISAASGLKFIILWGYVEHISALNNFFPIVDMCLSCEDIVRQSCAMVPRWRFLATFCVLCFQRAACSRFQTGILNSH